MQPLIIHPENPAKVFLRRYRFLLAQQKSLVRSIEAAYERATSCTARLKPVTVAGGNGAFDRMAEDVCRITDEVNALQAARRKTDAALLEILEAIESVPDAAQKAVLIMRYVEGLDWAMIAQGIHYELRQTFILHGRALLQVRKWLEARNT